MTQMMEVYRSASSSTSTPTADVTYQTPTARVLVFVSYRRHDDPYVSEQLAAEIRDALAAAERGETEDLGSFAQYADDPDDED